MKSAPILALTAAGALLGWYGTDLADRAVAPSEPQRLRAPDPVDTPAAASASGALVLPRQPDGHFYADVTVDGATSRMLVDTGASVVALAGPDAEAMGLSWSPDELEPVARGAGGAVHGVRVMLERVQLGDVEVRDVAAVVVPDLPVSLLGQSFLRRAGTVEMTGDEMVLGG